ncbi:MULTISPECIES: histidinol-phosphate transaminase [unclassified Moraxella]|uniref:histidinol-phosphate transaminase n=1 Tax=unclassified Moraxella TaxID=2685852 RepID=UPI003AF97888
MTITPAFPSINVLKAYQIDKPNHEITAQYGVSDIIRLASNENPLGCSPKVATAIEQSLGELSRYPDGAGFALKQDIAKFYGVDANGVVLGNGSNELLNLLVQTFVNDKEAVVYSQYAFSLYEVASMLVDADPVEVPAKHFSHDLSAMQQAVLDNPNTKLVFIANPNNPTGTLLDGADIRKFIKKIPADVLVVIDEAYIELTSDFVSNDSLTLLENHDNVVILRTFSKAYGLAGLRIGYAITSEAVADMLNRTRQAFNTNMLAHAGAKGALQDQDFIKQYRAFNSEQRDALYKGFDSLGLVYVKSATNFVMVNVGDGLAVYQALLEQGVVVRPMAGYGLVEWIRVTVGLPEENNRFLDTLAQVLS